MAFQGSFLSLQVKKKTTKVIEIIIFTNFIGEHILKVISKQSFTCIGEYVLHVITV